jgi:glycerone phosphate O-acyltransferase
LFLGATSINDSLQLLSSTDSIYIDDNGIIHPAVDYKPSLRLPLLSYIITDINKITLSSEDKDNIFSRAFVYLKLAHYRNQILNWFVLESMLLLCLQGQIDITIDILKRKFYAIHMAVCKEFILPQKPPKILFKETLQNLSDRGLIEVSHSKINLIPQDRQTRLVSFLGHLVQPFIAGVWVMCLYLISLNGSVQTVKLTYENSQLLAMKLIHRRKLF